MKNGVKSIFNPAPEQARYKKLLSQEGRIEIGSFRKGGASSLIIMEIELERTFLLKNIPTGLEECKSTEILDIYIPRLVEHPVLRIRKRDNGFEITKKFPLVGSDSSEQGEYTVHLSKEEFEELTQLKGKRLRKIRYYYPWNNRTAEIDIYLDDLEGFAVVDFEFNSREEKDKFEMPNFCLADVTQEKFAAGGMLAGKKYSDLQSILEKWGYKKIIKEKNGV